MSEFRKKTGDPTTQQKTLARLPTEEENWHFHKRGFTSACLRHKQEYPIDERGQAPPWLNGEDLKDPSEAEAVNAT